MRMNEPIRISSEDELDDLLSDPYPEDIDWARQLRGDVLVLGAGGKMGPTLVRRIARSLALAGSSHRVRAVSRFSQPGLRAGLEAEGADTIVADLLAPGAFSRLPDCESALWLVGSKFGSQGRPDHTWATNAYLPGRMMQRYPDARVTVLSTGNVYPLVAPGTGGCGEEHPAAPVGEYAESCLGRERVVEYFSRRNGTRVTILRLNYAVEARYGVLLDVARRVWEGEPVPLEMGYVNVIWQGDANSACFRSLALAESPPLVLNLTGEEVLSVRELAEEFAARLGREARFEGRESPTALLSDARRCRELLGPPHMPLDAVLGLVADWVRHGGPTLGKPTRFEVRDGKF